MFGLLLRFTLVLVFMFSSVSFAHDDSMATLHVVRVDDNQWVFEVKTPLYGLDLAMRQYNADKNTDLSELVAGSNRYKELVVEYIKSGFDVTVRSVSSGKGSDAQTPAILSLGKGRIKLDDHMSTLMFEINGMPMRHEGLDFRLAYMASNETQSNLLRLIEGDRDQRFVLSFSNNFTVEDTEFFKVP